MPYHRERDPVPIAQQDRWAPYPVSTCVKNLAPQLGFYSRTVEPVKTFAKVLANHPVGYRTCISFWLNSKFTLQFISEYVNLEIYFGTFFFVK
jgi:hypothetical protein